MEIYIVRHGKALDHGDQRVTSDEMRWLIEEGRAEIETMAALLARLGVTPDLVLTSPLVRARQTAEIIAERLRSAAPTICDELAPGGSPGGVLAEIAGHGKPKTVVAAGHMPGVAYLVGYLLHHDPDCGIGFKTGAIARIGLPDGDLAPGAGRLRWMIPPTVAQRLLSE